MASWSVRSSVAPLPIQQTYSTGLASAGRALDTATRSTLNSIIHHTVQPMIYVSIGSATHAAIYHDWDAIKSWIPEQAFLMEPVFAHMQANGSHCVVPAGDVAGL